MGTMIGTIQQLESKLGEFTKAQHGYGIQLAPLHMEAVSTSRSPATTDDHRPAASRRTTETLLPRDPGTPSLHPRTTHFPNNQASESNRVGSADQMQFSVQHRSMSRSMSPIVEDSRRMAPFEVRPHWENSDIPGDSQSVEEAEQERTRNFVEFSRAPSLTDHHAALILEDLAFDRTSNLERQNPENNGEYSSFAGRYALLKPCCIAVDRDVLDTSSMDVAKRVEPSDRNGLFSLRNVTIPGLHVLPDVMKTSRIMAFFVSLTSYAFVVCYR
jgi:hypothetical protein